MSDQPEGVADDLVKELADKAHDLDAVRKSVEDAASLSGTLWLSYLFALFYIGIAAGAVTHKDPGTAKSVSQRGASAIGKSLSIV